MDDFFCLTAFVVSVVVVELTFKVKKRLLREQLFILE